MVVGRAATCLAGVFLVACFEPRITDDLACDSQGACPRDHRCEPVTNTCVAQGVPSVAGLAIESWSQPLEAGRIAPPLRARLVDSAGETVPVSGGSFLTSVAPATLGQFDDNGPLRAERGIVTVDQFVYNSPARALRLRLEGGGIAAASDPFDVLPSPPSISEVQAPPAVSGCSRIDYMLSQAQGFPVDLVVEVDPDGSRGPKPFGPATQGASAPGTNGANRISSTPGGRRGFFTWNASLDVDDEDTQALLRLTPIALGVAGTTKIVQVNVTQGMKLGAAIPLDVRADRIEIADLDRDGWPELVTAERWTVGVYFSRDGYATYIDVIDSVSSITVGDFDGGGPLEIAVGTGEHGIRVVHLGDASSRELSLGLLLEPGRHVSNLLGADLTPDRAGDDLLFLDTQTGDVLVRRSSTTGFEAPLVIHAGQPASSIAKGGFDRWPGEDLLVGLEDAPAEQLRSPLLPQASKVVLDGEGSRVVLAGDLEKLGADESILLGEELRVIGEQNKVFHVVADHAALGRLDQDALGDVVFSQGAQVWAISQHGSVGSSSYSSPRMLAELGLDTLSRLMVVDLDRDGREDVVVLLPSGDVQVLPNITPRTCDPRVSGPHMTAEIPGPHNVVFDLNLDGKLDIVAFDEGVQVAHGRGDGSFANLIDVLPSSFDPAQPSQVWAHDADGDGQPDLLSVHGSSLRIISVSPDSPGQPIDRIVEIEPSPRVALGDVDADGRTDLVYLSVGGVKMRLGAADGTFGTPLDIGGSFDKAALESCSSAWDSGCQLDVTDADGDGDSDVVVVIGGDLVFFGQNSDGTFSAAKFYSALFGALVGSGDFLGNGRTQIAVVGTADLQQQVRLMTVDQEAIETAWTVTIGPDFFVESGIAADLDGDNNLDLILTALATSASILVVPAKLDDGVVLDDPVSLHLGHPFDARDVDGDHRLDLVGFTDRNPGSPQFIGRVGALTTARNGAIGARQIYPGPATNNPQFLACDEGIVGHLDRGEDRLFDAVCALGPQIVAYRQRIVQGSPTVDAMQISALGTNIQLGDLNGDGFADVLSEEAGHRALLSDGDGTLAPLCPDASIHADIADINRDAHDDLLVVGPGGPAWVNSAEDVCAAPETIADAPWEFSSQGDVFPLELVSVDLNNDGWSDLIAYWERVWIALHELDAVQFETPRTYHPQVWTYTDLAVGDLDRDGWQDVLVCFRDGVRKRLHVLPGTGGGILGTGVPLHFNAGCEDVLVADLDQDGWLEVVADDEVWKSRQDGSGLWDFSYETGHVPPFIVRDRAQGGVMDFDQDGRLDLARIRRGDGLVLFRGR